MSEFCSKVIQVVKAIPKGQTLSYQEVAERAGNKKASRAVAMILSKNTNTSIPCHRVIRSDGSLGGYNGLLGKTKRDLLESENAELKKH